MQHSKAWVPFSWCFTNDLNCPTACFSCSLFFFGMFQFQSLTWHLPFSPTVTPRPTVWEVNLLFNWHFGLFSGFWRANLRLIRDLLRRYIDTPRSHSPGTILWYFIKFVTHLGTKCPVLWHWVMAGWVTEVAFISKQSYCEVSNFKLFFFFFLKHELWE